MQAYLLQYFTSLLRIKILKSTKALNILLLSQVAAVQTGAMQLSVDIFNAASSGHYELKTDIQIKGVCATKVPFSSRII